MSVEDKELEQIFSGEEKPLHPDTVHVTLGKPQKVVSKKETHNATHDKKSAHTPTYDFKYGKWEHNGEPTKSAPNWMDNLKSCAKWVVGFGGLSFLLFYWKEAGLMAESIAVPSIALCTMLAGWGVGKNAR